MYDTGDVFEGGWSLNEMNGVRTSALPAGNEATCAFNMTTSLAEIFSLLSVDSTTLFAADTKGLPSEIVDLVNNSTSLLAQSTTNTTTSTIPSALPGDRSQLEFASTQSSRDTILTDFELTASQLSDPATYCVAEEKIFRLQASLLAMLGTILNIGQTSYASSFSG